MTRPCVQASGAVLSIGASELDKSCARAFCARSSTSISKRERLLMICAFEICMQKFLRRKAQLMQCESYFVVTRKSEKKGEKS